MGSHLGSHSETSCPGAWEPSVNPSKLEDTILPKFVNPKTLENAINKMHTQLDTHYFKEMHHMPPHGLPGHVYCPKIRPGDYFFWPDGATLPALYLSTWVQCKKYLPAPA